MDCLSWKLKDTNKPQKSVIANGTLKTIKLMLFKMIIIFKRRLDDIFVYFFDIFLIIADLLAFLCKKTTKVTSQIIFNTKIKIVFIF